MAKKVKCIECANSMDWDIPPVEEIEGNLRLQDTLKNYIVCGHTMRCKHVDHCQYCKVYEKDSDGWRKKFRNAYEKELEQTLKKMGE